MQAKSRVLLFILVSFILGGLAGALVQKTFLDKPGPGRSSKSAVMKEFTEKLNLLPDQTKRVDSLLEAHKTKFSEIRKGYSEMLKTRRDTLRKAIRGVLTGEQNTLFDHYVKEMDERESRYRKENR